MNLGISELVVLAMVSGLALAAYCLMLSFHPRKEAAVRGLSVFVFPIVFAVAGYITPPDVLSMLVVAVPVSVVAGVMFAPLMRP